MTNVYIANFGEKNYEWPTCLERSTIATMNDVEAQPLWERRDKEAYIQSRMLERTAAGKEPTRAVAARWYNLMTIISESVGDIWIHSDTDFLWWTQTTAKPATFERKTEPVGRKRDVIVCHKPCEPWKKTDRTGRKLPWAGLHPKAKDFLATEATLQKLSPNYSAYAHALINGDDLAEWHEDPLWKTKRQQSRSKSGPVTVYSPLELAAFRMAHTAFATTSGANGQIVERTVKDKDMRFRSKEDLRQHVLRLLGDQDQICALSGLDLNIDEHDGDPQLRASLDRIDSNGHYEEGNLQVVCRFINRWKGADDNKEFQRLMSLIAAY